MKDSKFDVLVEEVISRYQQGGLLQGDFVIIRKDALNNPKIKDKPSNFIEMVKNAIATKLPLRVSMVKSERPESSNDLVGGVNHSPTGYWVDVCVEYAPGLWRDPMTLPLEVLDIANPENYNLPEWPDEVKRKDNSTIKPEEIKQDSKSENIKQTQGDERQYGDVQVKIDVGEVKDGRDQTKVRESLEDIYLKLIEKKEKPDYLDFDKDGNKKESMKKALKDKKAKKIKDSDLT